MLNNEAVPLPTRPSFQNLTGLEFGKFTVLSYAGQSKDSRALWTCKCSCGTVKVVTAHHLKRHTHSCGCLRKEVNSTNSRNTKHGLSKTLAYPVWISMKSRCTNTTLQEYPRYGGRGIKVCDRWLESFENFYEDMGERPSKAYSIDRIDVNGDYEPSNCRWASRKEQANNRRNTFKIMYNGIEQTGLELSKQFNIPASIIRGRLRWGWTIERALSTPYQGKIVQ